MAIITDTYDLELAHKMFQGKISNPCMLGMDMQASVYGSLADIYFTAAEGAAQMGKLQKALDLEAKGDAALRLLDQALELMAGTDLVTI